MMILGTVLAVGIEDIGPWVFFINAAMIAPALPLAWLRWFWARFNIWGELFGLVISVPLASYIWFGLDWEADSRVWQPTLLLLAIGLFGSVAVSLLTPAESAETLRSFYLKVRPHGAWGRVRRQLAAEGLIDLKQQRAELRWDLVAAAFGVVFCFAMVYAMFMSVMLHWQAAAAFSAITLATGAAYFYSWLRSSRTAAVTETDSGSRDIQLAPARYDLEIPAIS
jgi:hypothetical protein